MLRLAITPGEPAGIGPDLAVVLSQQSWQHQLVVIADPELLEARAQQLGYPHLQIRLFDVLQPTCASNAGEVWVLPVKQIETTVSGQLNVRNAPYVLNTLETACQGLDLGHFDALITGPVHKGIINDAGIAFTGHTEWFAERAGNIPVVMMLACEQLRVALATTHLPLRDVADAITVDGLTDTINILYTALQRDFGILQPNVLVSGLNPHAGEGGHLGHEEIDVIAPVCQLAQRQGWHISNPLPADTLFSPKNLHDADAFLCMFHDQGLPVLKQIGFGKAVNITLGLPYVRTSVDHGTALDLAGTGKAEVSSFIYAINTAIGMAAQRRQHA